MVLLSLSRVSNLSSLMPNYSDGVWILDMIQLMLSYDIDGDDGARDLIMRWPMWI
jgi:hypothetical protein